MKKVIPIISVSCMLYLCGAFVAADFNIAHWSEFGRYMLGVIWLMIMAAILHDFTN